MRGGIHAVSVLRPTTAAGRSDDEGRVIRDDPDPVELQGVRVASLDAEEANLAAQAGEDATASVHVPHHELDRVGFYPRADDAVTVADVGQYLDGTWTVTSVRPTRSYVRVLIRKVDV